MRSKTMLIVIGVVIGLLLAAAGIVVAGDLNPSVGPTGGASQMYTLEQIYTRLSGGGNATKATAFSEPAAGPGSTMHTLDDIYALAWPARVPKTGQTWSFATGDDGDLQRGVAWPSPRFTDNSNGTVTDNLTGLIWLKNANCFGTQNWATALASANTLNNGECGLSDGSAEGAWRLPNVREQQSWIDYGQRDPALPSGHPFTGVAYYYRYWTSTSTGRFNAWSVGMEIQDLNSQQQYYSQEVYMIIDKLVGLFVWPVRGGQ